MDEPTARIWDVSFDVIAPIGIAIGSIISCSHYFDVRRTPSAKNQQIPGTWSCYRVNGLL